MTNNFVKDVKYFSDTGVLEIVTHAGAIWQYARVSPEEYALILAAQSTTDAVRRLINSGRVVGTRKVFDA